MDEEEDPFLKFIDYAQLILKETENDNSDGPGWSWIASRILKTCVAYSSGVTPAILLSDLSQVHPILDSLCISLLLVLFFGQIFEKI